MLINTTGVCEISGSNGKPVKFVTSGWLVKNTGFSRTQIHRDVRKGKISHLELWYQPPGCIMPKKVFFYSLKELTKRYPKYKLRMRYKFVPPNNVLARKPKDLSDKEYWIFLGLLNYRIEKNIWPSLTVLIRVLENNFSLMELSRTVVSLVQKGYLKRTKGDLPDLKNQPRSFFVCRGPKELLVQDQTCLCCGISHRILREFCVPGCIVF